MSTDTMRAVLIKNDKGSSEDLFLGEAPRPALEDGQILVSVKAFGLNRMDILQREGKYPVPKGASKILGVEFSGVVEETGSNSSWQKSDEVFGLAYGGAYAQTIAVDARMVARKPAHLTHVQAASVPEAWVTAYQHLIKIGGMRKGDRVLMHAGASSVGLAVVQLARHYGAALTLATAGQPEKIAFLEKLGVDRGINYRTEDFAEVVAKVTDGKGVNVIIDPIGADYFARNISSLAPEGCLTILAFMSGSKTEVNLAPILLKRLRIEGSTLRARSVEYQSDLWQTLAKEITPHLEVPGGLRLQIHKVFPWQQVKDAHKCMEASENIGKIICTID